MSQPWDVERVAALAPDPASLAAGRRLATPTLWSALGHESAVGLWGLCQGSGRTPYETVVDLAAATSVASRCSCPSRKFPCKHALGLLLLLAGGQVPVRPLPAPGDPAGFATTWLRSRAERAERAERAGGDEEPAAPAPGRRPVADPAAAARRVAQRVERVTAGLDELDQWLADQVRAGLSGLERSGPAPIEAVAARMVDAQAPGVAARLRRLPAVLASGEGWPARMLEQVALLRLLVQAHRRLALLPAPLAAAVRAHVGYPTARDDVLAGPPVRDTWAVLARRDTLEDRLAARRVWLRGAGTGRPALVLSYAPVGQPLDESLVPGTGIDADLHFYAGGIRALVGARHDEPGLLPRLRAAGVDAALGEYAAALALDPWTASWPVLLEAVAPVRSDGRWWVREAAGTALPVASAAGDPWRLVAVSGGEPVTVAGEWSAEGFLPLSAVRRQDLVAL
jgi:SWIM zinc finger